MPLRPGLPERRTHKAMPPHVEVHRVPDNYSTHKTKLIRKWLLKHPRYRFPFTPTSVSRIK